MRLKLNPIDIDVLDNIFNQGGYVLDFTNATFDSFFKYYGIDIYDNKYAYYGNSKGKRFRRFLEIENLNTIGKILQELIKKLDDENHKEKVLEVLGIKQEKNIFENENIDIENDIKSIQNKIYKYSPINEIISNRLKELLISYQSGSYFSVMVLSGSILEGVLLSIASKYPKEFNIAKASPKQGGKIKSFDKWGLKDFIDVAYEIKFLDIVSQKYTHFLREFRNFIHPYEAYSKQHSNFDKKSAEITIKVLIKSIEDLDKRI